MLFGSQCSANVPTKFRTCSFCKAMSLARLSALIFSLRMASNFVIFPPQGLGSFPILFLFAWLFKRRGPPPHEGDVKEYNCFICNYINGYCHDIRSVFWRFVQSVEMCFNVQKSDTNLAKRPKLCIISYKLTSITRYSYIAGISLPSFPVCRAGFPLGCDSGCDLDWQDLDYENS